MTAPHEPNDPTASELGSTAQFKAFVQKNDEPQEARERASADPDASRAPVADPDDDRQIQFSEPVQSGPPVQSLRPDVELPPAELGSTEQFRAFASGEGPATGRSEASRSETPPPAAERPAEPRSGPRDEFAAPALPPADPGNKRTLLVSLLVIVLVVIAVILLFVLV